MDILEILDIKEAQQWTFSRTEKGVKLTKMLQDRDVESTLQIILQHIAVPTVGKVTLSF
jgi:hypothetical protein